MRNLQSETHFFNPTNFSTMDGMRVTLASTAVAGQIIAPVNELKNHDAFLISTGGTFREAHFVFEALGSHTLIITAAGINIASIGSVGTGVYSVSVTLLAVSSDEVHCTTTVVGSAGSFVDYTVLGEAQRDILDDDPISLVLAHASMNDAANKFGYVKFG